MIRVLAAALVLSYFCVPAGAGELEEAKQESGIEFGEAGAAASVLSPIPARAPGPIAGLMHLVQKARRGGPPAPIVVSEPINHKNCLCKNSADEEFLGYIVALLPLAAGILVMIVFGDPFFGGVARAAIPQMILARLAASALVTAWFCRLRSPIKFDWLTGTTLGLIAVTTAVFPPIGGAFLSYLLVGDLIRWFHHFLRRE